MLSKEITSKVIVMTVRVVHQKAIKRAIAVLDEEADHVLDPTAQKIVSETIQMGETTIMRDLVSGK